MRLSEGQTGGDLLCVLSFERLGRGANPSYTRVQCLGVWLYGARPKSTTLKNTP